MTAIVTVLLLGAPLAHAATPSAHIQSSGPLTDIWIGNDLSCQVAHSGNNKAEFYPGVADVGDCGTFLSINGNPNSVYRPDFANHAAGSASTVTGTAFTPVSQTPVSGAGTSGSPYQVTTVVDANPGSGAVARVTEVDSYVVGNDYYTSTVTVQDLGNGFSGKVYHAGDCYLRGFDTGYGALGPGAAPACTVTPNNSPPSALEQFVPVSPAGNNYIEAAFGSVWSDISSGADFANTCDCTVNEDNGAGINWDTVVTSRAAQTFTLQTKIDEPAIGVSAGQQFTGSAPATINGTLATVTDSDTSAQASNYEASIYWGDGSAPSPGSISGSNGSFTVSGSHTYLAGGAYTITVAVQYAGNPASRSSADDSAAVTGPPPVTTATPLVTGSSTAAFSGSVTPEGLPTQAFFQYGLDAKYSSEAGTTYGHSTPAQGVGADFSPHAVSAAVSGLVPNAVYHVRLVARNSAGTTFGPDRVFTTAKDTRPLPPPVLGQSVNVRPVSGLVLIKPPPGKRLLPASDASTAALAKGQGFIPLTEARQVPTGSQIDSRRGSLALVTAAPSHGKRQTGTFTGGLYKLSQLRTGLSKGLTTLSLLEGAFRGAPSYAACPRAASDPGATAAALSARVLQTLRGNAHGRFRTVGRYAAATVRGTNWGTVDRCDGTLTLVHRGTVAVSDFVRHVTVLVHAGHRYLARAPARKKK